jgi:hypothetical protein
MKKRRKNINESIHVLMTEFNILGKLKCSVSQIKTFDFYNGIFFKLCTCFLNNLVEFHLRNKEVLPTIRR